MKQLTVLCGEHCAYCKKAKMLIRRALERDPRFAALGIHYICDESPEAGAWPHTLVPAFFVERERAFEGNPDMARIMAILRLCYDS